MTRSCYSPSSMCCRVWTQVRPGTGPSPALQPCIVVVISLLLLPLLSILLAAVLPNGPTPSPAAVLLSHSDPAHLGALPYLVGRLGLAAPVYATGPVHKMGQMFMYDQYLTRQVDGPACYCNSAAQDRPLHAVWKAAGGAASRRMRSAESLPARRGQTLHWPPRLARLASACLPPPLHSFLQAISDFDVFNLDDVDAAFALVHPLRYQQNMALRWAVRPWRGAAAGASSQGFVGRAPRWLRRSPARDPAPRPQRKGRGHRGDAVCGGAPAGGRGVAHSLGRGGLCIRCGLQP